MENINNTKEYSKDMHSANAGEEQAESAFVVLSKKTDKLVTALYMVTDCMEFAEPVRTKLRAVGADLVSGVKHAEYRNAINKHFLFEELEGSVSEVLSFLEIASSVGLISSMNGAILSKEFSSLSDAIKHHKNQNKNGRFKDPNFEGKSLSSFLLGEKDFGVPVALTSPIDKDTDDKGQLSFRKDIQKKDAIIPSARPIENSKGHVSRTTEIALRISRRNDILKLIKDSKEVTIKDISKVIIGCSEKTIQRELTSLISEGVIKKVGEKRWSRYSIK